MQIAKNKVVSFDYSLTNAAGNVIDSSQGGEPLVYLHGAENIIPGLEKALEGKASGDALKVTVAPAEAYGEYNKALTEIVPGSMFQGVENIEAGMQFQAETSEGVQVVTIAKVDGDQVTIDGNHPLAGEHLSFDVTITDVREATEDELEHGHVHGEGCNH